MCTTYLNRYNCSTLQCHTERFTNATQYVQCTWLVLRCSVQEYSVGENVTTIIIRTNVKNDFEYTMYRSLTTIMTVHNYLQCACVIRMSIGHETRHYNMYTYVCSKRIYKYVSRIEKLQRYNDRTRSRASVGYEKHREDVTPGFPSLL